MSPRAHMVRRWQDSGLVVDLPFPMTTLLEPAFLPRGRIVIVAPRLCSFWGMREDKRLCRWSLLEICQDHFSGFSHSSGCSPSRLIPEFGLPSCPSGLTT